MSAYQYLLDLYYQKDSVFAKTVAILIRGVPGSGKTTLAMRVKQGLTGENTIITAADDFFTSPDGTEYKYDPKLIGSAHSQANLKMEYAMHHGANLIVHNTATRRWEADHIINLATQYRVPLIVIDLNTRFENEHGVPAQKVKEMGDRFESVLAIKIAGMQRTHVTNMDDFNAVLFQPSVV